MELLAVKSRKRKAKEETHMETVFSLDELNQDLLEKVLSWLPPSSFFRLRSVCKRWRYVAASPTFRISCSEIPDREPWFLMVDQNLDHSIVFDTSEWNWKNLSTSSQLRQYHPCNPLPVAAAGGLVCYRSLSGDLIVRNPITGLCRELTSAAWGNENPKLHAIAMHFSPGSSSSYRIVLISGELSNLSFRVYDSKNSSWEDEVLLVQRAENCRVSRITGDEVVYFLNKAGDVVATDMLRSPSKQYSSVLAVAANGEEVVYFLSQSGTVVACNLSQRHFIEYPRLLPIYLEYSIDLVECKGEMLAVILSEFLETASLRIWRFCEASRSWRQVASMPPAMSHEFYSKKVDVNCTSAGNVIFVCVNSGEFSSCVMFDMDSGRWAELPKCLTGGKAKEFMSAFAFEPRLEATV